MLFTRFCAVRFNLMCYYFCLLVVLTTSKINKIILDDSPNNFIIVTLRQNIILYLYKKIFIFTLSQ